MNLSPAILCPLIGTLLLLVVVLGPGPAALARGRSRSRTRRGAWLLLALMLTTSPMAPSAAEAPATAPNPPPAKQPRRLEEQELRDLLTQTLNQRSGPGAEWELRFTRPWTPIHVPDDFLTLELVEPALSRLTASCLLRFELRAGRQTVGSWQMPIQAHLWRDVWVARSTLSRGLSLADAPVETERRDVLPLREPLSELPQDKAAYEIAQTVPAGSPLTAYAVRPKPVVYRGQLADAIVRSGAMEISLKVEVLEEGAPGQVIRIRNPQSRRELRGKVQDERTIAILL